MISGFYTAASGMINRANAMNPLTDNMAYANVAGYKKQEVLHTNFDHLLQAAVAMENPGAWADLSSGTELVQGVTNFSQGDLRHTGRSSDLAIEGRGFFAVDTGAGTYYTRNGSFRINGQGGLVTDQGHAVLDSQGAPIVLNFNVTNVDGNLVVDDKGQITLFDKTTNPPLFQAFGTIGVTEFEDLTQLRRVGHGLWANDNDAAGASAAENSVIHQGYQELSNGNIVESMVDMMVNQRIYDTNAEALKRLDGSLRSFIQTIGS